MSTISGGAALAPVAELPDPVRRPTPLSHHRKPPCSSEPVAPTLTPLPLAGYTSGSGRTPTSAMSFGPSSTQPDSATTCSRWHPQHTLQRHSALRAKVAHSSVHLRVTVLAALRRVHRAHLAPAALSGRLPLLPEAVLAPTRDPRVLSRVWEQRLVIESRVAVPADPWSTWRPKPPTFEESMKTPCCIYHGMFNRASARFGTAPYKYSKSSNTKVFAPSICS